MAKKKPEIIEEVLELPENSSGKYAVFLRNVYTKEECDEFIRKTEEMGYEQALINVGGGRQQLMTDVRNSDRCIWDSPEQANELFERIKDYLPKYYRGCQVVECNERLRFLRYDPGGYFKPHMDGVYRRDNGESSYVTVMLYLNEGYEGGSTNFLYNAPWLYRDEEDAANVNNAIRHDVEIVPETGSVLLFEHEILHEGCSLIAGRKYAARTDVMYTAHKVQPEKQDDTDYFEQTESGRQAILEHYTHSPKGST